jgi:hypothetical protein
MNNKVNKKDVKSKKNNERTTMHISTRNADPNILKTDIFSSEEQLESSHCLLHIVYMTSELLWPVWKESMALYGILVEAFDYVHSDDVESFAQLYHKYHFDIDAWDPEYRSQTLLFAALMSNAKRILSFLLYLGANKHIIHPKFDNLTPQEKAWSLVRRPRLTVDSLDNLTLLDDTIDANGAIGWFLPNAMDRNYEPPLFKAIKLLDVYAVKYLLERRGVKLDNKILRENAIAMALERMPQAEEIVRVLMVHGADITPMEYFFPSQVQSLRGNIISEYHAVNRPSYSNY